MNYCGSDRADLVQLSRDLRALLEGKLNLLTRIYPCDSPTERRWFFMFGLPLAAGTGSGVAILQRRSKLASTASDGLRQE